ncbi:MAG: AI-2E family transporter [Gemmataceae bacterium]|nr:AI-2E family transporter [Gemmataceae bacterium]
MSHVDPAPPQPPVVDGTIFLRRLRMATYGLVLFVLTIYVLEKFERILQPLFIAVFLGFLTNPIHRWLVRRGLPSFFAYGVIVTLVLLGVSLFGTLVYTNFAEVADQSKLLQYEKRLEDRVRDVAQRLPFKTPELKERFLRDINISPEDLAAAAGAAFGRFRDSTTLAVLTILYIFFLIAEKVSFPARINLAFGEQHGTRIMSVVESINLAISQYIAVKTLVSALAGILSYAVLAAFEVELAATWGILIFLLNFIPYLGSLVACALPIVLSFLQFDEMWKPIVIVVALIGIQQVIATWVEPQMAGQRLDVSPLLIVLSLAFWGFVWGIPGAILAVPLLVIVKIVLDNIPETKPIATLISNR